VTVDVTGGDRPYPGKRAFDLVLTLLIGPFALVVGAVCSLAVKVDSRGPVFFRQERVGMNGRAFRVFKFRTMVDDPDGNPLFPDADRITRVGRVLRRLSLDELPQLLNVVSGDMSIVGPRPTLAYQVERYTPSQRRRLAVRPGLTGLAQVRGRNTITWDQRIEHDLEYLDRQSALFDLWLVLRTVPAMLAGSGVEGHPTDDHLARPEAPTGAKP
jgi:lipopolysaccharide/colanic/teichoic acid biosynthesis glycosyltransferase